ncbi:hypothetical protein CHS0354_004581 [Potamilus streckersoni]|uniref:Uncharacterized protein n=1 Tax=Potamilus streckersoni TaxID=2493646 RepID=A0AAE0S5G8_9BIVA|nr:hypothetical protein CHS0354_004581 [Potamilus streckersoni]
MKLYKTVHFETQNANGRIRMMLNRKPHVSRLEETTQPKPAGCLYTKFDIAKSINSLSHKTKPCICENLRHLRLSPTHDFEKGSQLLWNGVQRSLNNKLTLIPVMPYV